ncbi:hypothetical protein ACR3AO_003554 [Bacillus wiedmannii]
MERVARNVAVIITFTGLQVANTIQFLRRLPVQFQKRNQNKKNKRL